MRDERDVDAALRSWLREDDAPTMDRNRRIGRIMGRVDETKQRRRLWPLIPFGRRAMHSATGARTDGRARGGASGTPARALGSPLRAAAAVAIVVLGGGLLLYASTTRPAVTPMPAALPTSPRDAALFERLDSLWDADTSSGAAIEEVYAEDAVRNVLWHDRVERLRGRDAIASRIGVAVPLSLVGERIRLADAPGGERRFVGANPSLGGIACLSLVADDRVTREDCILPYAVVSAADEFVLPDPSDAAVRERLTPALAAAWASGERDALDGLVAPDIEHHVAYDNHEYTLRGPDEYATVTGHAAPQMLAPPIDLPAPAGETRWTDVSDIGGGSLCVFWARDDLIVRHDCLVPMDVAPRYVADRYEP